MVARRFHTVVHSTTPACDPASIGDAPALPMEMLDPPFTRRAEHARHSGSRLRGRLAALFHFARD
jgi:hypothetical protein